MIAVRLHSNVNVHGLRAGTDGTVPVVAALEPDVQKKAEDLPFLAGWLRFLEKIGGSEDDFRAMLRESDQFAAYADADLGEERDVLTYGEALALIELGLADAVEPDFRELEAEVEAWRQSPRGRLLSEGA